MFVGAFGFLFNRLFHFDMLRDWLGLGGLFLVEHFEHFLLLGIGFLGFGEDVIEPFCFLAFHEHA